jgi:hypothetical protein
MMIGGTNCNNLQIMCKQSLLINQVCCEIVVNKSEGGMLTLVNIYHITDGLGNRFRYIGVRIV